MADDGLTLEAWSMPHVGVLTKKFNFTKYVVDYKFNDRFNDLSDGTIEVPDDFPLKAELFHIDEANHANDVGSMIRVLRGSTVLKDFIVTKSEDTWSDAEPTQKLTVEGLEWLLDRATVPHYDWPKDPTVNPDWIYGADSILANSGIEASIASNAIQSFWHQSTGGTFTFSDGTDTTAAIAWNASFDVIALRLETDLTSVVDVRVSGNGTFAAPWVVEWISPGGVAVPLLTTNGTNLTGGDDVVRTTIINAGGVPSPTGWTISYNPQTGESHGTVTVLEPSTVQVHSGTYSMRVVGAPAGVDPPGAQQLVAVQGGATYRAEMWVWSPSAQTFRLVVRTLDETMIASVEVTVPASTWTKLTIPPFVIPEYVSQVIFRIGTLAPGLLTWYFDDALLAPGFPEATLGLMMNDVRLAAVVQGVLTWLTPTWTTTLDSDGVAWDQNRKWNVNHDQSFLQLWEYVRQWNYEIRIRWDVADNRFEWDMWNPNGGGQIRANIAITGKSGVSSSGPIVKRPPDATYMRMEGEQGHWGEFASTTLDDVWGRLERAQKDRQSVHSDELDILAQRKISRGQDKTSSRSVQVEDPSILPWTAYEPGDTVYLNLGPKDVRKQLRIAACVVSMGGNRATPLYEVHFVSPVLTNDAAMAQGLRYLLREFKKLQAPPIIPMGVTSPPTIPPPTVFPGGGSWVMIAAFDSRVELREAANFLCDGVNDEVEWQAAIDFIKVTGGTIFAAEGTYTIGGSGARINIENIVNNVTIWGDGKARLVATSTLPGSGADKWIMFIGSMATPTSLTNPQPTLTIDGMTFDGNNVTNSAAMAIGAVARCPHVEILRNTFTRFNGRCIYGERGNLDKLLIAWNTFRDINCTGGGFEAPNKAIFQFNAGSFAWNLLFTNNVLDNVDSGATTNIYDAQPLGDARALAIGNIISSSTNGLTAGVMFIHNGNSKDASNWINGTWTP